MNCMNGSIRSEDNCFINKPIYIYIERRKNEKAQPFDRFMPQFGNCYSLIIGVFAPQYRWTGLEASSRWLSVFHGPCHDALCAPALGVVPAC